MSPDRPQVTVDRVLGSVSGQPAPSIRDGALREALTAASARTARWIRDPSVRYAARSWTRGRTASILLSNREEHGTYLGIGEIEALRGSGHRDMLPAHPPSAMTLALSSPSPLPASARPRFRGGERNRQGWRLAQLRRRSRRPALLHPGRDRPWERRAVAAGLDVSHGRPRRRRQPGSRSSPRRWPSTACVSTFSTPSGRVIALEGDTGRAEWTFRPPPRDGKREARGRTAACRTGSPPTAP